MARKLTKQSTSTLEAPAAVSGPSDSTVRDIAQMFKLLSDETRLKILYFLARNGELHVTDLCANLGQSQPAVSHHLALLRVSGLIEARRDGKHNYYSVQTDHFANLLFNVFSVEGEVPRKIKFNDFLLTYSGS